MIVTRKIGSILRGTASRSQILLACVLGGALGFVPGFFLPSDLGGGFLQAPGLILTILGLVLLLDANLALFGLVTVIAKLLSLLLLPVSFAIGRFLLDGPTEGLFRLLVNAPVTAWFGFERYATTGGLALGLVFGSVLGMVVWKLVHGLRVRMATVEEGSERWQKLTGRRSTRFLTWVFLGKGRGKKTWREVAESDRRNRVVRWWGLAAIVVLAVGLWFAQDRLGSAWLQEQTTTGLARWNGATVDLESATLDLGGGHVALDGLAMANADDLDRDVFRARSIAMDVSTRELLAGRLVVDRLVSSDAMTGAPRERPAERIAPEEPTPPPPPGDGKTLEEYLKEAEVWKQRLETAADWIEKLAGDGEAPAEEPPAAREARIEREIETIGFVNVVATHLVALSPAVTVRDLVFEGMTVSALEDVIDVHGKNLSSAPALVDAPASIDIRSRSGTFSVRLAFDPKKPTETRLELDLTGVPVDSFAESLAASPIRGGTMDVRIAGNVDPTREAGVWVDVPVTATLRGTTLRVGDQESTIETLAVPIGVRGPLSSPRITLDDQALADALVAAGKQELANQVRARADALLQGKVPGIGDELGDLIEGEKTPEELVEEAKKKAEEEARKKAEEELKKRLPGGLGGILPKKDG